MEPREAISEIEKGEARPVYLILGEERVFSDRVVSAARKHVVDAATAGFNVDLVEAGDTPVRRVVEAANTRLAPSGVLAYDENAMLWTNEV